MTPDERESQLSAMFDGELPPAERELVARRLSRDEALRETWGNYALIGAVMRGETLASAQLAPRVAEALMRTAPDAALDSQADDAAEFGASSGRERAPRLPRWAIPASGFGLAAGIAVVGVFSVFWLGSQTPSPVAGASMVAVTPTRVAEVVIPSAPATSPEAAAVEAESNGEPLRYVTPPVNGGAEGSRPVVAPPFNLASYVGAHSAVSSPMMRHSAISAIIAADAPMPGASPAPVENEESAR